MGKKLAAWSWISPVIGLALSVILLIMAGENLALFIIIIPIYFLGSVLGLIFGIVALRQISKNPKLTGKSHAIVGIILSGLLILIPLKNLLF